MSLQVKIKTEEQENSFLVFECTGNYSGSNPGGFGPPNYRKEKITKSVLLIQGPSDKESYPWSIDVTGDLPNSENIGYEVLPSQIGQTNSELESGLYKIKLTHTIEKTTGGTTDKTGYTSEVFVNNISCCIDEKSTRLNGQAFNDEQQTKIIELSNLLESAKLAACNGLFEYANTTIDYLKSQCKCNGCK